MTYCVNIVPKVLHKSSQDPKKLVSRGTQDIMTILRCVCICVFRRASLCSPGWSLIQCPLPQPSVVFNIYVICVYIFFNMYVYIVCFFKWFFSCALFFFCFACIYVCIRVLNPLEMGLQTTVRYWKMNPGLLEEQPLLLIAEPSL